MSALLKRPTLFITMGLPASGKTYFSQRLAKDLNVFFLNGDSLRMAMIQRPTFKPQEHALVFSTFNHIVREQVAQGFSVVANANYHVERKRREMQAIAREHGADLCILWTRVPYETAQARIVGREHEIPADKLVDPPLGVLARMKRNFEEPAPDEQVIKIDGTIPYEDQYKQFLEQFTASTK
jgi:predicted kinase